jgi:hypothetical protein
MYKKTHTEKEQKPEILVSLLYILCFKPMLACKCTREIPNQISFPPKHAALLLEFMCCIEDITKCFRHTAVPQLMAQQIILLLCKSPVNCLE